MHVGTVYCNTTEVIGVGLSLNSNTQSEDATKMDQSLIRRCDMQNFYIKVELKSCACVCQYTVVSVNSSRLSKTNLVMVIKQSLQRCVNCQGLSAKRKSHFLAGKYNITFGLPYYSIISLCGGR